MKVQSSVAMFGIRGMAGALVGLAALFAAGAARADVSVQINNGQAMAVTGVGVPLTLTCDAFGFHCEANENITYQWSLNGAAVVGATGQTYTLAAAIPGTWTVGCTASVEGCGTAGTTISSNVIGGPIYGQTTINYFGISPAITKKLAAAGGQPAGTTYSWSMSGPGTLLNGIYPTASWTGSANTYQTATYRATGPSDPNDPFDVQATLVYTLGLGTSTATLAISALEPTTLHFDNSTVPNVWYPGQTVAGITDFQNAPWYGFNNYYVKYTILDQFRHYMPAIPWNEMWLDFQRPAAADQTYDLPESIGGGATPAGVISDYHEAMDYNQVPDPHLVAPNWVLIYSLGEHEFRAGSLNNGEGILLATHVNVEYRTNGVTNDQ